MPPQYSIASEAIPRQHNRGISFSGPPPPSPFSFPITRITAPVHVELAPRRREAMTSSRGRRGAGRGGREVRPGHGDGVVDVQVAQEGFCNPGQYRNYEGGGARVRRGQNRRRRIAAGGAGEGAGLIVVVVMIVVAGGRAGVGEGEATRSAAAAAASAGLNEHDYCLNTIKNRNDGNQSALRS